MMRKFILIAAFICICSLTAFSQHLSSFEQAEVTLQSSEEELILNETPSDFDYMHTETSPGTPTFDYKESKYWGRYTALRTAGWISLGVGAGFFIGGYAALLGAWSSESDVSDTLAVAGCCMLFSSPVLVVTSIPLLACAYYNRSKAKKMYINAEVSFIPADKITPFKYSTPALGFAMHF